MCLHRGDGWRFRGYVVLGDPNIKSADKSARAQFNEQMRRIGPVMKVQ